MTETDIKIGPVRPQSGPMAKGSGAAISQGSSSISDPVAMARQNQIDIRSLQDQIFAILTLLDQKLSVPMLIASGPNHQPGVVPDPDSTSGTAKFLREDATWTAVSATALTGVVPVLNGGTGTATGSIQGTGALTFTSGGATAVVLKPGTNSTTAIQLANAAGTAVVVVDTTNGRVGIGGTPGNAVMDVQGGTSTNVFVVRNPEDAASFGLVIKPRAAGYSGVEIQGTDYSLMNTPDILLQPEGGLVGVAVNNAACSGTGKVHFGGDTARIVDASRTPANSAAAGNDGEICYDSGFGYLHTGGSWRRWAVATF